MVTGFNTDMRRQEEWGWLLAIWLFMGGASAALFLFYQIGDLPRGLAITSIVLLFAGGGVLLVEQGSPLRAWRALFGIGTSWLSRGIASIGVFVVCAVLAVLLEPGSGAARAAGWLAALAALMVVFYPGFFLAGNRAVPFWHTPLLPIVFLASALLAASALTLLGASFSIAIKAPRTLSLVLLAANGVLICWHFMSMRRAGAAAEESLRLLMRTPLAVMFWAGVVLGGMLLPFILLAWAPQLSNLAGGLILLGCLLCRYCIVRAGVYVPVPAMQPGLDFSRLMRTSSELEREYAAASIGARR